MIPGAHIWELARDYDLALTQAERDRITLEIQTVRASCLHVPNPERSERCYKCGVSPIPAQVTETKPGPVKARRSPLDVRRTG